MGHLIMRNEAAMMQWKASLLAFMQSETLMGPKGMPLFNLVDLLAILTSKQARVKAISNCECSIRTASVRGLLMLLALAAQRGSLSNQKIAYSMAFRPDLVLLPRQRLGSLQQRRGGPRRRPRGPPAA